MKRSALYSPLRRSVRRRLFPTRRPQMYRRRRMYRKKISRTPRPKVGERSGTSNSKTYSLNSAESFSSRQIVALSMLEGIGQGDFINQRERQHIDLAGIKMFLNFRNKTDTAVFLNYGVLGIKNTRTIPESINPIGFFRSNGTSRTGDFDTTISSVTMHNQAINTDDYIVLMHKRKCLASRQSGTGGDWQTNKDSSYLDVAKYLRIKRQIRYAASDGEPTDTPIYFFYFITAHGGGPGAPILPDQGDFSGRFVIYFNEPKV